MKKIAVLTVFVLSSLSVFSQSNNKELRKFSETEKDIIKYRSLSQQAWDKNEEELALSYVDSIKVSIVGSYVDGHVFRTVDDEVLNLKNQTKPTLLITSATWCAPCIAEIPALNRVAEEFSNRVTFVVLFSDVKGEKLEKVVKRYGSSISVVPSEKVDENVHALNISGFRHITGYPTNYSLSTDGKIVAYSQGATVATTYDNGKGEKITITKEKADELNYARLREEVEFLIKQSY